MCEQYIGVSASTRRYLSYIYQATPRYLPPPHPTLTSHLQQPVRPRAADEGAADERRGGPHGLLFNDLGRQPWTKVPEPEGWAPQGRGCEPGSEAEAVIAGYYGWTTCLPLVSAKSGKKGRTGRKASCSVGAANSARRGR